MIEVLTGATISRRVRNGGDTISLGGSSTEKISRGFVQLNQVVAYDKITDLIPSVSSWGVSTITQVQSKFGPLGAAVREVDGGIVVEGQLDCGLGEEQNVVNVLGSVVIHTLPNERDRGYRPGV